MHILIVKVKNIFTHIINTQSYLYSHESEFAKEKKCAKKERKSAKLLTDSTNNGGAHNRSKALQQVVRRVIVTNANVSGLGKGEEVQVRVVQLINLEPVQPGQRVLPNVIEVGTLGGPEINIYLFLRVIIANQ